MVFQSDTIMCNLSVTFDHLPDFYQWSTYIKTNNDRIEIRDFWLYTHLHFRFLMPSESICTLQGHQCELSKRSFGFKKAASYIYCHWFIHFRRWGILLFDWSRWVRHTRPRDENDSVRQLYHELTRCTFFSSFFRKVVLLRVGSVLISISITTSESRTRLLTRLYNNKNQQQLHAATRSRKGA